MILSLTQTKLIQENSVFEKIYLSHNYHLIQRSGEFLRFVLDENLLTEKNLELIWQGTQKNDNEQKMAIFDLLSECSVYLSPEQKTYLIQ